MTTTPALPSTPPGDHEIRRLLLRELRRLHADQPDTAYVEELGLCRGRVRVDVAVVNGVLHGFEIKSDRDSLRRLAGQVDYYGRVLDRASLVVGVRHAADAMALLPEWWEVHVVDGADDTLTYRKVRSGTVNPGRQARALVELLWHEDAIELLEARGGAKGYRARPRPVVWDRVCEVYTLDEVAQAVRDRLKARSAPQGPPPLS